MLWKNFHTRIDKIILFFAKNFQPFKQRERERVEGERIEGERESRGRESRGKERERERESTGKERER